MSLNTVDHAQPLTRRRIAFVLLPGFSLLAHACALEPLQMANQLSGQRLYQTVTLSLGDSPVRSGAELSLNAQHALGSPLGPLDMVFVCAPAPLPYGLPPKLNEWLRDQQSRKVCLGGVAGGTELLARYQLSVASEWRKFDDYQLMKRLVSHNLRLTGWRRKRWALFSGLTTMMTRHRMNELMNRLMVHRGQLPS